MNPYGIQKFGSYWAIQMVDAQHNCLGWVTSKENLTELDQRRPGDDATFESKQEAREHVRKHGCQCIN